jgi:hypothetical protein
LIARRVIPIDTTPAGIDVRLDIDTLMSGRVINGYLMHKNDQIGHTYLIAPVAIRNLTSCETRWTVSVPCRLLRFSSLNIDFTTTLERRPLSLCRVDIRLSSCQLIAASSIVKRYSQRRCSDRRSPSLLRPLAKYPNKHISTCLFPPAHDQPVRLTYTPISLSTHVSPIVRIHPVGALPVTTPDSHGGGVRCGRQAKLGIGAAQRRPVLSEGRGGTDVLVIGGDCTCPLIPRSKNVWLQVSTTAPAITGCCLKVGEQAIRGPTTTCLWKDQRTLVVSVTGDLLTPHAAKLVDLPNATALLGYES